MKRLDHRAAARLGFVAQLLLLAPFLLIFGATTLNVVLGVSFLALAAVRYRWPHNMRLRQGEMVASYLIGAVWVVHHVV